MAFMIYLSQFFHGVTTSVSSLVKLKALKPSTQKQPKWIANGPVISVKVLVRKFLKAFLINIQQSSREVVKIPCRSRDGRHTIEEFFLILFFASGATETE